MIAPYVDQEIPPEEIERALWMFEQLKAGFPEIELAKVTGAPEDSDGVRVHIVVPEDEEREEVICERAAELSVDLLLRHGSDILIWTLVQNEPRGIL